MRTVLVIAAACGGSPPPRPAAPVANTQAASAPAPAEPKTEPDDLELPPIQTSRAMVKVDIPIPGFQLPPKRADDAHTPYELRVRGKKLLDTKLTVHGFVTYAYDCAKAIRKPGETERAVKNRIDADPTLCERPKFFLGDSRTTPVDKSLWVVDVPRPYNKLELERIKREDRNLPLRCEPDERDPAKKICPTYRVGDEVTVTGDFKLSSPHAERNSDGLLVYGAMTNPTARWTTPGTTWPAAAAEPAFAPSPTTWWEVPAATPVEPKRATRPAVDRDVAARSREAMAAGLQLAGHGDVPAAVGKLEAAVAAWSGNHAAWYALGLLHVAASDWTAARDAFEHTVQLRPDVAMYQLMFGVTGFESIVESARQDQAKRFNRRPAEISPDLSAISFERPTQHLEEAIRLAPDLWRAHYYLGKCYRASDQDKLAAQEFATAILLNPGDSPLYVALAELYRRWDYVDEAITVASAGTRNAPSADLWFELGVAYVDKRDHAKAIAAFDLALQADAHHDKARFQRGLARYHMGDLAGAQKDLEEFIAHAGPELEFPKQEANQVLLEIHAKPRKR